MHSIKEALAFAERKTGYEDVHEHQQRLREL